tara:strand:+ start:1930 stop:3354 length:1425 start_codon:yes stop_codon:yes gene_type:complete
MRHFYDGQIRRYTTQMMRILSNFPVIDGDGQTKDVPVMYGDLTRQVANIIRENSENKLPSAPRISVYITGLELDKDRLTDSTYTRKTNIRERAYDDVNKEYLNTEGKSYTVERLIPTPYLMRVNADIWASNTDQKLQILEQILVLFNPSLEMQTTDNFIDWTSITAVILENVQWSSRSVPVGIDSEIDIATLSFSVPIYISPPTKVRKMGVITNIITSMFDETNGTIEDGVSRPELNAYDDTSLPGTSTDSRGTRVDSLAGGHSANVNFAQWGVYVNQSNAQLVANGLVGVKNWREIFTALPGTYAAGVSRIYLSSNDNTKTVTGTFALNPLDEGQIAIDFDADSFPSDDIISSALGDRTSIDYIIDPLNYDPTSIKTSGLRILLLDDIGGASATQVSSAWANNDGTGLVASANDIVEWDGSKWNVIFDASTITATTYVTNLNTQTQYRFKNNEWLLSIDGDYPVGTWRIDLFG